MIVITQKEDDSIMILRKKTPEYNWNQHRPMYIARWQKVRISIDRIEML